MKRFFVALALAAGLSPAWAQPGIPPVPAPLAAAAPALGAPTQSVTVANKCCSIFDFLGVKQIGGFVDQTILKSRLGQAVSTAVSPVARALGLGPSLLSDKFAKGGGAMELASQIKKEEKKVPLKIQAIKYLATLDCQCYTDVVPVLLESLKDCSEKVRYEALQALHHKCGKKGCLSCLHHKSHQCTSGSCDVCTSGNCPPCDCGGCACKKEVIDELNKLLLARDEFGCLKEKSERVRALATQIIEECLVRHQPHPGVMSPAPVEEKKMETPVQPDTSKPDAVRMETVPTVPAANSRFDIRGMLPKFFGGNNSAEEPTVTEPAGHMIPESGDSSSTETVTQHVVGYRGTGEESTAIPTAPAAAGERVIIAPPQSQWNGKPKRRHLMGEMFGY